MSEEQWAALVYGRTYTLDFRFITIPSDFTKEEIDWSLPYILATVRQASKLSSHPRWLLFKNESHCVVGVTCMVRDLLADLDPTSIDLLSKDNRGRPLYIFVGYVTQLKERKYLIDLPPYMGNYLNNFQPLYQYVLEVWEMAEYQQNSKKPLKNNYRQRNFSTQQLKKRFAVDLTGKLNHEGRFPDKTLLWKNLPEQNTKLWATAATCNQPISICIGNTSKKYLNKSPFLNQTIDEVELHTIDNYTPKEIAIPISNKSPDEQPKNDLSQLIVTKAKEDLELTLKRAISLKNLGQNIIINLVDWLSPNFSSIDDQSIELSSPMKALPPAKTKSNDSFGFKTKQSSHEVQDWF